jgi:hypothetical protein
MTVLESLKQFFLAFVDVIKALVEVFEPHLGLYLALAAWILFWVGAVNWVRLRRVLLAGGWIGVVFVALLTVLVWGSVAPPEGGYHYLLGLRVGNYIGKIVYVTGFLCIMLISGSVQLAVNPHQEEEPPAEEHGHSHAHAHSH